MECKLLYLEFLARRNSEEEEDLQEIYFSWSGPGPIVGYASVSSRSCNHSLWVIRCSASFRWCVDCVVQVLCPLKLLENDPTSR